MILLAFFLAGLVWDWLVTIDLFFATHGRWAWAGITSGILGILSMTLYAYVFVIDGLQWDRIIVLSIGSGVGTAFAVWRQHRKKKGRAT